MPQVRAETEEVYPYLSDRCGDNSCLCVTCLCLTSPALHLPSGAFPSGAHFCSAWDAHSQRESPFRHPGTSCSQLRFLSPIRQGPWKMQCPPLCPSGHLFLHLTSNPGARTLHQAQQCMWPRRCPTGLTLEELLC